jgi:hypothetical protein
LDEEGSQSRRVVVRKFQPVGKRCHTSGNRRRPEPRRAEGEIEAQGRFACRQGNEPVVRAERQIGLEIATVAGPRLFSLGIEHQCSSTFQERLKVGRRAGQKKI